MGPGGLVRAKGLEPPHLSILEPKSSASTSSATPAGTPVGGVYNRPARQGKADAPTQPLDAGRASVAWRPPPVRLVRRSSPAWLSAAARAMARPRPLPPVSRL